MSIWNYEKKRKIKKLEKDIETNILIIGAGMTGLTTAYYLQNENICVVDANLIGHGVTLNSTAKINYFQERIYTKIKNIRNSQISKKYLESQKYAIYHLKKIIEDENIKCELEKAKSYVFANKKSEIKKLNKEIEFLKNNGVIVEEDKIPYDLPNYKSYSVNDTYTFNPIKYLEGIYQILSKKNINIYENTKILKIKKNKDYYICYGENFKIKTKTIVLASHYPFFTFPFLLPFKSYIEKSYIIVSKVKEIKNITFISSSSPTYSCRFYKDKNNLYQISLAHSQKTSGYQNDAYHFKKVKEIFILKEKNIVMSYSNMDIITPDYMPFIGKLKDNFYIGVGYNTWGITNSVLAAKIISDSILKHKNEFNNLFNPNRFNKSNIIKLPMIITSQTKSFLKTKINKNKSWYSKNVTFSKEKGKNIATYIDESGHKHTVYNKCPHLGCSLIFNETEKTWDCPCHSSRFDIDGKCIKGPSNYDITYKN